MQSVRRRKHFPDSDAPPHYVGHRRNVKDRHGCRHANAHASVRSGRTSAGSAAMAGIFGCGIIGIVIFGLVVFVRYILLLIAMKKALYLRADALEAGGENLGQAVPIA